VREDGDARQEDDEILLALDDDRDGKVG